MMITKWLEVFEKKKHNSDRITLNFEFAIKYDFYIVRIRTGNDDSNIYEFKGFTDGNIHAVRYDDSGLPTACELSPENLKQDNFTVTHYYKANEFSYGNLREVSLKNNYHKVKAVTANAVRSYEQYRFNKQKLMMKDRQEILSIILNKYFSDEPPQGISSISVMSTIYTAKWLFHPESTNLHTRIRFYLNSLVSSGDLKIDGMGNYLAQPKALETLEKYRHEDDREQRDNKIKYWTLFWSVLAVLFTFFSAWGTLVQAGILPVWTF